MRTKLVLMMWLLPGTAVAQVVADSYDRADSTDLGTTDIGARPYREWGWPGSGAYSADLASIAGNRLLIHGGTSGTDPAVLTVPAVAHDLELRVQARFLDENYPIAMRANAPMVVMRSTLTDGQTPIATHGMIGWYMTGDGTYGVDGCAGSPATCTRQSGVITAAAMAAADDDGDGVLESTEPFQLVIALAADQVVVRIEGVTAITATLPAASVTGVDTGTARTLMFGRTRVVATPTELEIEYDDLAVFEDLCPLDPDKLEPGMCGCGAPETAGCGDAGVDAPIDAPVDAATDAASDAPPAIDAAPGPDAGGSTGDDDGGCCGSSREPSASAAIVILVVGVTLLRRRRRVA